MLAFVCTIDCQHDCMTQENFWILFSKKIAGEANDAELAELESLMREHPEWQYAAHNLEQLWQSHAPVDSRAEEDAFLLHIQRMQERGVGLDEGPDEALLEYERGLKRRRRRRVIALVTTLSAAASITVFLFLTGFFSKPAPVGGAPVAREVSEISTRPGSKSRIQLPDGSTVWINAGSKLTYDKSFGGELREVNLQGEAFFDVVHDADRPFIIHASAIDIRVLGTAFNVKAYPEDAKTETSLIRGSIEVSFRNRPNDKIILSPNEKLVVDNQHLTSDSAQRDATTPLMAINKLKVNPTDSTVAETLWVENRLVFDDESLAELAVKMERWYGVEIEIKDSFLKEKRFTGNFQNENIEQAMEALTISYSFSFERNGNKIFIHR